jgi:exosortase
VLGIAALVVPTLITLGRIHWTTDNGAHGPLILVSGIWLIWRERAHIHFRPGAVSAAWLLLLVPLLLIYVYARVVGMLGTETAALYLILFVLAAVYWGPATMRRLWFALVYLAFLIKPPYGTVAELTQPLKVGISEVSVAILSFLNYPVAASGVLIQIGQYELLVREACAGLGSMFTLLALGMLYVHLTGAPRGRSFILLMSIIPIAVLANLLRVIVLVLLTYHAGDAVAQSFAHDLAGLATFGLSLLGMVGLDALLTRLQGSR